MLKNYLKIAIRNLLKYKAYSFINIIGLAIGIGASVLIFLYVYWEMTYDTFHQNAEYIYRITTEYTAANDTRFYATTNNPLAPALLNDYPEIVNAVRLTKSTARISFNEKPFQKEEVFYADSDVFDMFSFSLLRGNPTMALQDKNAMVISEEIAQKYFGAEDPIGKIISFETGEIFKVTGILQKLPQNSSIKFKILLPFAASIYENSWWQFNVWTYVQLSPKFSVVELEKQLPSIIDKYLLDIQKPVIKYQLQRLTDIHLHSHLLNEIEPNGNVTYSYILLGIAFFILFIACINFMNLSTARFFNRAKEIGMRKVLGAARSQLVKQFLGEAILLSAIASLLGITLAEFFRPIFNDLVGKQLAFLREGYGFPAFFAFLGLILLIGIVSGSYPAFFQSSFHTLALLKENLGAGHYNVLFRRVLIVLQFSLSIIMIVSAWILSQQVRFMKDYDLGFNKEQVVVIPIDIFGHKDPEEARGIAGTISDELSQSQSVVSVSLCAEIPGHGAAMEWAVFPQGWKSSNPLGIKQIFIDDSYFETFGMKIIEGRNFSEKFGMDISGKPVILNEAAVKVMGWQSALDKEITGWTGGDPMKVVGVVKDYHFQSLHHVIEPLLFAFRTKNYPFFKYIAVRISPQYIPSTLGLLEKKWQALAPNRPFEYFFLDDEFNKNYQTEEKMREIIISASLLAIFVACLGLLGLAALAVTQKTKEIGIRKVLGASVVNIVALLSKEFVILVTVANVLAWPVAYFAVNHWLQNFAYRIHVSVWPFVLSGLLALLIALATVSFQTIKAALANPVKTLRYE